MGESVKRTGTMRQKGLRELRLVVVDSRSPAVRRRVAKQVARLNRDDEREAMAWIAAVSEFDVGSTR